jgi:hypothetical protein
MGCGAEVTEHELAADMTSLTPTLETAVAGLEHDLDGTVSASSLSLIPVSTKSTTHG